MSSNQIYVLEALIERIEPQNGWVFKDLPAICVGFKFAQVINFDIGTEHFSPPQIEENSQGCSTILMNYGKTFLFVSDPADLQLQLRTVPYRITLYEADKTVGSVTRQWKAEFSDMVANFVKLGLVKSTTTEETYDLCNDRGTVLAKMGLSMKMSCFGPNLQTTFQIKGGADSSQYIFRQRNLSKTFKVEKYGDERNQPLIAPLYTGIGAIKSERGSQINVMENVSLTQLFDRAKDGNVQFCHPQEGIVIDFQDDFDKISICYRPSENKFFDLLELISADIKTKENKKAALTIQRKKADRVSSFMTSVGGALVPEAIVQEDEDMLTMTSEKIAKKLCGNRDCPAVKKFKEYGIGPLATGPGLGTLYGAVEPPVTYGMSHTYGTMCEYGPYGAFSRPKHESLPFLPPTCENVTPKSTEKPTWHSCNCPLAPRSRLRGGADDGNIVAETGDDSVRPKSPMLECKSIMDQFDDILSEYKKALGPCGHATCPYGPNFSGGTCKRICDQSPPPTLTNSSYASCNEPPCNLEGCPYADMPTKKQYPAGCGNPKCAYTKYKLGLVDEDAELELQFLPPAVIGNCGDPHCKYPFQSPLPPIHWDCPDPLPKGPCRNLNCPFQPAPLKKLKTKKMLKTGPCGSPLCPYALPQPCANPTCPFKARPCPMSEKGQSGPGRCDNNDCPFTDQNVKEADDLEGEFQDCTSPECPAKAKPKKTKSKRKKTKRCANPDCSAVGSKEPDVDSVCSNPECPARPKVNSDKKSSSSSSSVSVCSDPQCPFAALKKTSRDSGASCHKSEDKSVCSNPECLERKQRDKLCDQPDCPYSKATSPSECNDPRCPYAQPLPSCGVPNCPYEPIPLRFSCTNPQCPSKAVDFSKSTKKSPVQTGLDTNTVILTTTTTVCEDAAPCESPADCDNPDCEMKDGVAPPGSKMTSRKKWKRKKRGKFVYSMGDTYPGNKVGHKECVTPACNVPPHMGWLWNIRSPIVRLKPRRGWRPGALTKTIAARIRAHRQAQGFGYLKVPDFKKGGIAPDELEHQVVPKPTLQVQKKDGAYWITVNPLKDPNTLVENEDPYMECTPMTFKITKNKKQQEFCFCDGDQPLTELESSASSDSELDIEFTPPAGIIHPERFKKKPNSVCCEAQYDPNDFAEPKKEAKGGNKGKGDKDQGGKADKGGKGKKGKKK